VTVPAEYFSQFTSQHPYLPYLLLARSWVLRHPINKDAVLRTFKNVEDVNAGLCQCVVSCVKVWRSGWRQLRLSRAGKSLQVDHRNNQTV